MPEEPTANTAAAANPRSPSWSLMGQGAAGRSPPTPAAPPPQTRPPAKRQGEKRVQRILNSGSLLTCKFPQRGSKRYSATELLTLANEFCNQHISGIKKIKIQINMYDLLRDYEYSNSSL
jgi:hypothetical protein